MLNKKTIVADMAKYFRNVATNFTTEESCGKCTPCRIGTKRMLDMLKEISDGSGTFENLNALEELATYITENSLCGIGKTAPNLIRTAISNFKSKYAHNIVKIKINGVEIECPTNSTILDAAKIAGINIPTLCYLKETNEIGACSICVVEVKGSKDLVTACITPVSDGMEIATNSQKTRESRKTTLALILSNHRKDCLNCVRNLSCELQNLSSDFTMGDIPFVEDNQEAQIECSTLSIVRDNSKCVVCRRCTAVCSKTQGLSVIGATGRGIETTIGPPCGKPLGEVSCTLCGQCVIACPTAALAEVDDTAKVYKALSDETKHVVVITAPAIRVALGECFNFPIGTNVEGKMIAALRKLGFKKVFDVPVGADFTIMEESAEFIRRLQTGENLPILTSCCSSWVNYCEEYYPEFVPNLSSCKSPQMMLGALLKAYYANKMGIEPKNLYVVSVMPCVAKKDEIRRGHNQAVPGVHDIDVVITTRELANMIRESGIMFRELLDDKFDPALGISTGAGYIFGTSGGVMEAALRTVVEKVTDTVLDKVDFTELRGMQGVKEAEYDLNGKNVKVAVVSGLKNAGMLLARIKSGEAKYDMIEVMASPGGCIGGGGQPIHSSLNGIDVNKLRSLALYKGADDARPLYKSHESPIVQELYRDIIGEPGGEIAHKWLHTKYNIKP